MNSLQDAYLTRPYYGPSPSRTQYTYSYGYGLSEGQSGYYSSSSKTGHKHVYSSTGYKQVNVSKELIHIMRKQTFRQPITFNGNFLAKVAKIVRAVPDGTYIRVDYLVAPSSCKLNEVSLEQLYSASCPVMQDAKWRHCKGFFSEESLYTLSIYCEHFVAAEKEDRKLLYPSMETETSNDTEAVPTVKPPEAFPKEAGEVEAFVKERVFHSKFRIGHWYTRVMKVYEWKETESRLFMRFAVAPTTCYRDSAITFEQLYSDQCSLLQIDAWLVCTAYFPIEVRDDYKFTCDSLAEFEGYRKNTSTAERTTRSPPAAKIDKARFIERIKRLIHESHIQVGGWHAKFVKFIHARIVDANIVSEFAVAPSQCSAQEEISLEQLYSSHCRVSDVPEWVVCTITVPLRSKGKHIVTCERTMKAEKIKDPEPTSTAEKTTPSPSAGKINVDKKIEKIKRLIHESHIQVGGWHAKFVKFIRAKFVNESVVSEFAIAPSQCSAQQEIPLEKLYSSHCRVSDVPEWVVCTITEPLRSEGKPIITCERTMKAEKIKNPEPEPEENVPTPSPTPAPTPSPVSTPIAPTIAPTMSPETSADRSEVVSQIKRFLLESKVQLGGWHAKFVKLTKFEQIGKAIHVEFALAPSECSYELKVTLYQLYSLFCPTMQVTEWLLCRGEMPPDSQSHFLMNCGDRMKVEVSEEPDNYLQDGSLSTPTPDQEIPATNLTERKDVIEAIKRFIHNVRIEVNGHHARVVKLYRYESRASNILVEFALAQSSCKISQQVNILQLYSTACSIVPSDHWLLCNGVIPFSGRNGYSLSCSERIEADPGLPSDVENPLTKPNRSSEEEENPEKPSETDKLTHDEIISKIREYMFTTKTQVDGFHARVAKFYEHVERSTGIDVTLDIAPTNCSLSQKITLDSLYSDACPVGDSKLWVRCNGTIPKNGNGFYKIKCKRTVTSEHRDSVEVTTAGPKVPSTSESADESDLDEHDRVSKIIRHILFAERIELNGWHARLAELKIFNKDQFGSYVEFTIAPTECRSTLKKRSEIWPALPKDKLKKELLENVTGEIKEILFSEEIEIGGWRARLTEVLGITAASKRTHVRFIIAPCRCGIKAKVTMERLYSDSCPVLDVGVFVLCEGYLPFDDDNAFQCQLSNRTSSDVGPNLPVKIDPSDSVQISAMVTRLVFDQQLDIDGKYARFLALLDTSSLGGRVHVEFTLAPTECSRRKKVSFEDLYSRSCPLQTSNVLLICEVVIPPLPHEKVKCTRRSPQGDLRERIIVKKRTTHMDSSRQLLQVHAFMKQLLFDRKLDFDGFYPKIVQMFTAAYEKGTIRVRFVVAATTCSNSLKITLGELYSKSCPVRDRSKFTLCKAVIHLEYRSSPTIDCDNHVDTEEKELAVPCAPSDKEDFCQMSAIDLTSRIKKAIFAERIQVAGCYPKLLEIKELERRGNEAYFRCLIAPSKCKLGRKLSFEDLYSLECPLQSRGLIMECEGYLSSGAVKKYRVNCFGSSGGLTYEVQVHEVLSNMENRAGQ
ncbi:hypothetical protein TTRE_0000507701 [Trichuris trichiura]|uniref:Uncharacterized protein n=1 Tax=Trichuris trichiura TaxID=36087 RepID=A0A077ZDQ4_TRITR|nr:hypothetical protein TTRE_0000507701 [Trichuris trichiura]